MSTQTHTTVLQPSCILSETTWVSRHQKGKTSKVNQSGFTGAGDSEWQWHHLGHMQICTLPQTHNNASIPPLSFLQAGCPSCRPTNSVNPGTEGIALKASQMSNYNQYKFRLGIRPLTGVPRLPLPSELPLKVLERPLAIRVSREARRETDDRLEWRHRCVRPVRPRRQ